MRATRLIELLMELQAHGRTSAGELAARLDVTERTIYRDIDALGEAGIPVVARRGRGGGIELLGRWKSTLTGLTRDEIQSLLTLRGHSPIDELPLGRGLHSALDKLISASPYGAATVGHLLMDTPRGTEAPMRDHIGTFFRLLKERKMASLTWKTWYGTLLTAHVTPLGLVHSSGGWVFVYSIGERIAHRSAESAVELTPLERVANPPDWFELSAYWAGVKSEQQLRQTSFRVVLEAETSVAERMRATPHPLGWEIGYESFERARDDLLHWGGAVRVIEPDALRRSLCDFAEQVLAVNRGE